MDELDATKAPGKPLLSLNSASLLFIPGSAASSELEQASPPHKVVQVTVETPKGARQRVEAITSYFMVQHEVSELIAQVVKAHEMHALPMSAVRFTGSNYALHAEKKSWEYGKTLRLRWGNEQIYASADKWTFTFHPGTG